MKSSNGLYKSLAEELIVEALLSLMKEKDFRAISVSEIAEKAKIARRTFYYNFASKEEALQTYLETLYLEFEKNAQRKGAQSAEEVATIYFEFWQQRKDVVLVLEKSGLFSLLIAKFEEVLDAFPLERIRQEFHRPLSAQDAYYFNSFSAAGLWVLLERWIERGMKETPEAMAKTFMRILGNV